MSSSPKSNFCVLFFFAYFVFFLHSPAEQLCTITNWLCTGYVLVSLSMNSEIWWPEITLLSVINLLFKLNEPSALPTAIY